MKLIFIDHVDSKAGYLFGVGKVEAGFDTVKPKLCY
jgi:hypothetical protein